MVGAVETGTTVNAVTYDDATEAMLEQMFLMFDADGSGVLNLEEVKKINDHYDLGYESW